MITSNGIDEPPKLQRIFWALTEGAVATALLAVGGAAALNALQTVSIAAAFPFTILLIIMVWALVKAFDMDNELFARHRVVSRADSQKFQQLNEMNGNNDQMANGHGEKNSNNIISAVVTDKYKRSTFGSDTNNDDRNDQYDDEVKEWRIGFFDALVDSMCFSVSSCCMTFCKPCKGCVRLCCQQYEHGAKVGSCFLCLQSVFIPCWLQYKNGKKIGMYGKKGRDEICNNILWIMSVFVTPIVFVVLHILEIWLPGTAYLAWVVYVFWVFIGGIHRMSVREYYHLKGNAAVDITAYCFCYCFAVSQEALQCEPTVLL